MLFIVSLLLAVSSASGCGLNAGTMNKTPSPVTSLATITPYPMGTYSYALPTFTPTAASTLTSLGPEGGRIHDLVIDPGTPTTLYAATQNGGLFKSTDAGETWVAIDTGLTRTEIW